MKVRLKANDTQAKAAAKTLRANELCAPNEAILCNIDASKKNKSIILKFEINKKSIFFLSKKCWYFLRKFLVILDFLPKWYTRGALGLHINNKVFTDGFFKILRFANNLHTFAPPLSTFFT